MAKLVQGKGVNDLKGESTVTICGKQVITPAYKAWNNMLTRSFNSTYKIKHPSYMEAEVCEEWLTFSNFKKWHDENYVKGYELDKDLLVEGNKLYSPEFCNYVPHALNTLFGSNEARRGQYPQGLCWNKRAKKYQVRVSINKKSIGLGYYENIDDAILAYAKAKKDSCLLELETHKDSISSELYNAILKRINK